MIQCLHSQSLIIGNHVLLLYKISQRFFPHIFRITTWIFSPFLHIIYMILNVSHSYSHSCVHMSMTLCHSSWTRLKLGSFAFQGFTFLVIKIHSVSPNKIKLSPSPVLSATHSVTMSKSHHIFCFSQVEQNWPIALAFILRSSHGAAERQAIIITE